MLAVALFDVPLDQLDMDAPYLSDSVIASRPTEWQPLDLKLYSGRGTAWRHHSEPGAGHGGQHYIEQLAEGHHYAWFDRDLNTPNVIDIWFDFRSIVGFPNMINNAQALGVANALNEWAAVTGGTINFVQNFFAPANDILVIGTGDLEPFGESSGPEGTLGITVPSVNDSPIHESYGNHTIDGAISWMDFNETWDTTIGNGDPTGDGDPADNSIDYFTVAAHELGHALGLGHLDGLTGGPNLMDSAYIGEFALGDFSANDVEHMQSLYADPLVVTEENLDDGTLGTLRYAIIAANDIPGPNLITVDDARVPAGSVVNLQSALPVITEQVIIINTTAAGATQLILDGTNAVLRENETTIDGLVFDGVAALGSLVLGIEIRNMDDVGVIARNGASVELRTVNIHNNGGNGVVFQSNNNSITTDSLIQSNTLDGVLIQSNPTGTVITNTLIQDTKIEFNGKNGVNANDVDGLTITSTVNPALAQGSVPTDAALSALADVTSISFNATDIIGAFYGVRLAGNVSNTRVENAVILDNGPATNSNSWFHQILMGGTQDGLSITDNVIGSMAGGVRLGSGIWQDGTGANNLIKDNIIGGVKGSGMNLNGSGTGSFLAA